MFQRLRNLFKSRTAWYPLSQVPEYFFGAVRPGAVSSPEEALTISPFYAALRLYQTTVASLPLVTYSKSEDGGRDRATTNPAYKILHDRPNPAMHRHSFMSLMVKDVFLHGDFFAQIQWNGSGRLMNLFPIPHYAVQQVLVDENWNKAYVVNLPTGKDVIPDDEMLHVFYHSNDAIRGVSLLQYCAESVGLHRKVLDSATSFYANSARSPFAVKYQGTLKGEQFDQYRKEFREKYVGGYEIPFVNAGVDFVPVPGRTAEDTQIIQALGASVADVARWWNVDPMLLGDRENSTYSNLGAAHTAFYTKSIRPFLDAVELEFNNKLFGPDAGNYCEFLTDSILRGDPLQQAQVFQTYLQAGVMLRSEVREYLNLSPVEGLDVPLHPLNQGPALASEPIHTPDSPIPPEGGNTANGSLQIANTGTQA